MQRLSERTEKLFFTLVRAGLHPDSTPPSFSGITDDEWQSIYRTAVRQGVAGIAWDGLQLLAAQGAEAPGRTLKIRWALTVERIEKLYAKQLRVLERLAVFYRGNAIPVMLLKGYGLSRLFPRPEHRPCGDIDLWLYGRQAESDELMRRAWNTDIDREAHHHTTFSIDGVPVENHFDFLNVHSHPSNRTIERILKRRAEEPGEEIPLGGAPVQLPSVDFNALFLLRHAAVHFAAQEIGVRYLADWTVFIERCHGEIDWNALLQTARRMNMHRFLNCMNALAIDYMGLDATLVPPFQRDPALERRVWNDILQPEFSEQPPCGNLAKIILFKTRRWWANRWKHRIVYREGLPRTFLVQVRSHLMKPGSLRA